MEQVSPQLRCVPWAKTQKNRDGNANGVNKRANCPFQAQRETKTYQLIFRTLSSMSLADQINARRDQRVVVQD
jgi:hypothetical protein